MLNTNCLLSCEDIKRTRLITVLGKEIEVKNYICSKDGINYKEKPKQTKLRLSICPTSFCAAYCPFCIATEIKKQNRIDLKKLEYVLRELKRDDLIFTTSITGGEPFTDIELLNEVISMVFDIFGKDMELSLNTNGFALNEIHRVKHLELLESVHVSRHHYDDKINESIFGIRMPSANELKEIFASVHIDDLFVLNCMLLKDYINGPEEAHKMLDFASFVNAYKISFIECSPANSYCIEQAVKYDDALKKDDPSLLFTRGFQDFEFCRCSDGIYVAKDGSIMEFYGRSTKPDGCQYCRGLVFGSDNHLRSGFNGDIIY